MEFMLSVAGLVKACNCGSVQQSKWASWQKQPEGAVLAESNQCVEVEGNQYFPLDALRQEYFKPSRTHTECPWKGTASYYDVEVNGKRNKDAAWFYPEPKPAAKQIKGYIAFWKGVKVEK
jgi:uncharacterized protein (DUF427 family)